MGRQADDPLRRPGRRGQAEASACDRLLRRADRAVSRTGARILVDQLVVHGVDTAFCVPGESYIAVLDALSDAPIRLVVARHEAGAANMAEAYGKLTGRPGVCFVTRAPGATHASAGVDAARPVYRAGAAAATWARGVPGARLRAHVRRDGEVGGRAGRRRTVAGDDRARVSRRLIGAAGARCRGD